MTVGGFLARFSVRVWPPRMATSSSLTILTTCCAGFSAPDTSADSARSRTAPVNERTTGTATSASSSARRISRTVASMSASDSRPLVRRFLKVDVSRSDRVANTWRVLTLRGSRTILAVPASSRVARAVRSSTRRGAPRAPRLRAGRAGVRLGQGAQQLEQVRRGGRRRRAAGPASRGRRGRPSWPARRASGARARAASTSAATCSSNPIRSDDRTGQPRTLGRVVAGARALADVVQQRREQQRVRRARRRACRRAGPRDGLHQVPVDGVPVDRPTRCGRLRTPAHSGIQVVTTPARSSASQMGTCAGPEPSSCSR